MYPIFSLSEDGTIDTTGAIDDTGIVVEDTTLPGTDGTTSGTDSNSSGDGEAPDTPVSTLTADDVAAVVSETLDENLATLQSDVSYLAGETASNAGYISSTILDTFDRVLRQYEYDYYCAYRSGSDSYSAVLYLSDTYNFDGSTLYLDDSLRVELYRTNTGSGYGNYEYYYSTGEAGDIEIGFDTDLMYYTNCVPGYPALGEVPAPTHYSKGTSFIICLLVVVVFLLIRRHRK